ncbi:MAG: 16S rRNA (adenine(1518)-N(6)/adenine(1519)-N(6))-dimethyltransferase RsmA [Actinomycetota bacterium]
MAETGPQGRAEIRDLLVRHGLRPNQTFGQNFLVDPNVIRRIVALADVGEGSPVVEIGGGTGTLTGALAAEGAHVVVYEIDAGLVGILEETLGDHRNVEIRHADASKVNLGDALDGGPWSLVANLPYNVGTGIVLDALRFAPNVDRFVVMVQREVADRLLAGPGSRTYGLPSVVTALYAQGSIAFGVPKAVFFPEPSIGSAVVELTRHPAPDNAEQAIQIAAAAFGQRRKMLRKSLGPVVADPVAVLGRAGVDPTARPEDLAPEDFVRIAAEVGE